MYGHKASVIFTWLKVKATEAVPHKRVCWFPLLPYKKQGILRLKKMEKFCHGLPVFRSLPIQWKGDRKWYSCNHNRVLKMKFGHRDCLPDSTPQFHPVHISFILVLTGFCVELKKNLAVMANTPASVSQCLQCWGPGDAESITAGTSWMCLSRQTCQC